MAILLLPHPWLPRRWASHSFLPWWWVLGERRRHCCLLDVGSWAGQAGVRIGTWGLARHLWPGTVCGGVRGVSGALHITHSARGAGRRAGAWRCVAQPRLVLGGACRAAQAGMVQPGSGPPPRSPPRPRGGRCLSSASTAGFPDGTSSLGGGALSSSHASLTSRL